MLILGCGNRLRGDDAAGIVAAEQLRALGVPARDSSGETSELIEAWSAADDVVVIDAVATGAPPGTVHVWDGHEPLTFGRASGSSHGFGVAEAIELSRALNRLPEKLTVYGIEGARFEMGSSLSAEVEWGVKQVVTRIAGQLGR